MWWSQTDIKQGPQLQNSEDHHLGLWGEEGEKCSGCPEALRPTPKRVRPMLTPFQQCWGPRWCGNLCSMQRKREV